MTLSLQTKLISAIGSRRALKYFSVDDEEQVVSQEIINDILNDACIEIGSYCPIYVREDVEPSDDGYYLAIPAVGKGLRRISVRRVYLKSSDTPYYEPICEGRVTFEDGTGAFNDGWYVDDDKLFIPTGVSLTIPFVESYSVEFRVTPTLDEVELNYDYSRAAILLGCAVAIERIMMASGREQVVELAGVPKVTDTSDKMMKQITFYRDKAREILGDYMVVE